MDREKGMDVLSRGAWLRGTPVKFRNALLSLCQWDHFEAGSLIHPSGEQYAEMIGLASGVVELRAVLGRTDTPIIHFARPVHWTVSAPFLSPRRALLSHRVEAAARTTVLLARASEEAVRELLKKRPEWLKYFLQPAFLCGDFSLDDAADLLIRDSERRCAAVLLRLSGLRFADPERPETVSVPITQDELAGSANLSRSSVRTMLRRSAARGLIEQAYHDIIMRAPAALRVFVDDG